jgi:hypothetical protein
VVLLFPRSPADARLVLIRVSMASGIIEGSARSRVIGAVDRALQERGIAQKPD